MHRIVHDGRPKFGHLKHSIYSLLKDKKPGLIVDVGAAAGMMTRRALHYSPASRAICFEPFPGNWPHIEKTLGALHNVTIVKQAVSDQPGEADFYVSSTVSAEQNWHGPPTAVHAGHRDPSNERGRVFCPRDCQGVQEHFEKWLYVKPCEPNPACPI